MPTKYFGELPGFPVGSSWLTRQEVSQAGVHKPTVGGISGTKADGADSIVISGGYEDDVDHGDTLIYTGAGGNNPASGKQTADQTIEQPGNAGLITSQLEGLPVRVVRGYAGAAAFSPARGFRYDGLYRVSEHKSEIGKSGFRVWRYILVRLSPQDAAPYVPPENLPAGNPSPGKSTGVVTRIVRSTAVSRAIKKLYNNACQVCGARLEVPGGTVSEGAHIQALGGLHSGPDVPENVLCLCPNHHALFDHGGIVIEDDLTVRDHTNSVLGSLTKHSKHDIGPEFLAHHREAWGHVST